MICTSLPGPTLRDLQRQCREALGDLIEFRFDLYEPMGPEEIEPLMKGRRVIFAGTKDPALLSLGPDYADHPFPGVKYIATHHDFEGTPEDLDGLLVEGDVIKIATTAHSIFDSLRMLEFVRRHKNVIGLCMGEAGQITRILAPVVGSPWTYAYVEKQTAPGQISAKELIEVYKYYELGPETPIYGLMGDPVSQSKGYRFHNPRLKEGVYVPFLVRKGEAQAFLKEVQKFNVCGLSVTMPLKQEVIPGEVINTLVGTEGYNTDGPGALDAIGEVAGKHLVILGAGGAAKAIAREAEKRGARVTMLHRQQPNSYDILVQCTPVGMDGKSMPIEPERLIPGTVVMEIINMETPFCQAAKRAGCKVIYGEEMFVNQAKRQLDLWGAAL